MTRFVRLTALLLALLMLACVLSSCDWIDRIKLHLSSSRETTRGIPEDDDKEYIDLSKAAFTYSPYYTPIRSRHSYQLLSDGQKALYDELYHHVREVYPETDDGEKLYKTKQVIIDEHLLSSADIRVTAKALYDDNPELFWLSGTIYQLTDEEAGYTAVQMRSVFSPDDITSMQNTLTAEVNRFYADVPEGMNAYQCEKYVHDFICKKCDYDSEAAELHDTADRDANAYIIYGVMAENNAVCEGYARTMQLLLTGLGVDCVGIMGDGIDTSTGDTELHMWNAVELDGDWYYVDATWDDQLYTYRRYQYFNMDEKTMSKDHTLSPLMSELTEDQINGEETKSSVSMNIFLPECTATRYQYFIFECPHLESFDDGGDVKDSLYRAALDREEYLTVYIDPKHLDYDDAIDQLFKEEPQYFFSYVHDVNGWLSEYEIDNSNLTYFNNEERSVVTVMLSYY